MQKILRYAACLAILGCSPALADVDVRDPKVELYDHSLLVPAGAGMVRLTIDFAQILMLDRPAHTIVIGNPGIADAALIDGQTLTLVGKSAGTTNMIVLDDAGVQLMTLTIQVVAAGRHLITVRQGVARETYACPRRCEPVLSVGDHPTYFLVTRDQLEQRHEFANVDQ